MHRAAFTVLAVSIYPQSHGGGELRAYRIRLVRAAPQALDYGDLVLCGNALRLVWIYVKRMELDGETGGYHPAIQPDHCAIDRIGQNSRGAARGSKKALSAKDAKYNFGRMIDLARSEPVVIEKHGRPVVVVMAVEEYERLKSEDTSKRTSERT